MIDLIIVIVLNTILFVLFKLFPRYGVDNLQAIVVNYCVCVVTGSLVAGEMPLNTTNLSAPWMGWAGAMGCGFIGVFCLIAWRIGKEGLTVTTIANKLSLVIPVTAAYLVYGEHLSMLKLVGIGLALPAVYLSTRTSRAEKTEGSAAVHLFWVAILFVGSGLLDTAIKYAEQAYLTSDGLQIAFTTMVFFSAAIAGGLVVGVKQIAGGQRLHLRNLIAGLVLGIPNYFSLYWLIRLLHSGWLQSSAAIPVNNIGVVLLSTVVAILGFKEKAGVARILGLVLAVLAILAIAISDLYRHGV
jgi:drug/metabolite transporter (DMT)-like permease